MVICLQQNCLTEEPSHIFVVSLSFIYLQASTNLSFEFNRCLEPCYLHRLRASRPQLKALLEVEQGSMVCSFPLSSYDRNTVKKDLKCNQPAINRYCFMFSILSIQNSSTMKILNTKTDRFVTKMHTAPFGSMVQKEQADLE